MKISHILSLSVFIIIGFSIASLNSGCANMVPPLGGPKDTLPPNLLNVVPSDSSLDFNAKKIILTFDEYVQLENIQKNLIVSPTPKTNPTVEQKLKTITVTLRDTLEENTTYTLDFGRAIKDLNEGNPFPSYRYLFSTGKTIDSLHLSGKILIAESGKADSTLIVMLYKNLEDSAVLKEKSRYLARVDTSGNFRFENIAPGTYAIYGTKDEGGRRYMSREQLFAFNDSLVTSESQPSDIMLYAFVPKDTITKKPSAAAKPDEDKKPVSRGLKFSTNLDNGTLDLLSDLELIFEPDPLKYFDSTKIVLTDTSYYPKAGYSFKVDTSNKKITLIYPWPEATAFHVLIDTTFATDTLGKKLLRNDTLSFQTKKISEYGSVKLKFINLHIDRNPVLQFVQNNTVKSSHVFTNNIFTDKLFRPGEYEMRILFDENKNGVWDTGQFFGEKRQPEKVLFINKKINVRPNWDNELDIEL